MLDKNVFITGGDKGIGRAITSMLAPLYKNVIITYNNNLPGAEELSKQFPNLSYFQCDLADQKSIAGVAEKVLQRYGRIDILINNAGYENDASFLKMSSVQWNSVIRINLESIYYFSHYFLEGMAENAWGRVVNLTSIAGYTGAFGKSNYAAAKAGIVGFTKSLALEFGGKGICVNAVAPGAIATDMLMRIPEKYRKKILEDIPSHRFGRTEEVADLIAFLVSDRASYINGQTIHINGGSFAV
ncbi:3-oxoacyl-ACP reductase FabG [Phocaeicola sartorii]|uniref:3-oxoacyl-ACP reductase FabG n=1 Tax=Phocaeicola sartorii TaxID=671267 RepID=UPI001B0F9ECE|nr:3-oxoacyl-ACP reductase FabG [Lachnospiraceae bacterium]